jgi:hypothetical protein
MPRKKAPSNAVTVGGASGTAAGTLIEIAAAMTGHPLPPGAGAALGGMLTSLFAYIARGGRRGESD